ncbi:amidase [Nocardia sp. NPDC004278]
MVDAAISRIEQLNPTLNAVIFERFEQARREAKDEPSLPDGPLRGVPFLMKDLLQTVAGEPQSMGWKILKDLDYRAPVTGYVAQKFINSGLIRLGQTTVPEFGNTYSAETPAWGITRNPWDAERAAGGTSTGSAVAVASGMVPMAHGNDSGGSIRIPSAYCGLVGLKGSRGRTSLGPVHGDHMNASTEEGVLARSVRDVALAMDIISGNLQGDPFPAPPPTRPYRDEVGTDPGRLRIGFAACAPPDLPAYSHDARTALADALALLTSLGHAVEDSHPAIFDAAGITTQFLQLVACHQARAARTMEQLLGRRLGPEDFGPWTWALIERGSQTTAAAYIEYAEWRNIAARGTGEWWAQGYDVLVMPTVARSAPLIGELQPHNGETVEDTASRLFGHVPFTHVWNATGQPAITLPLHITPAGLPLGVTFVASHGREDILLRLASQLEQAAPWHGNRPRIHAGMSRG